MVNTNWIKPLVKEATTADLISGLGQEVISV